MLAAASAGGGGRCQGKSMHMPPLNSFPPPPPGPRPSPFSPPFRTIPVFVCVLLLGLLPLPSCSAACLLLLRPLPCALSITPLSLHWLHFSTPPASLPAASCSGTAGSRVPADARHRPQTQTVAWPLRGLHEGWYRGGEKAKEAEFGMAKFGTTEMCQIMLLYLKARSHFSSCRSLLSWHAHFHCAQQPLGNTGVV